MAFSGSLSISGPDPVVVATLQVLHAVLAQDLEDVIVLADGHLTVLLQNLHSQE